MPTPNQNPEQQARDQIDTRLQQAGWAVQSKNQINLNAALGVAIREYPTDVGPADYWLTGLPDPSHSKPGAILQRQSAPCPDSDIDTVNLDRVTFAGWDAQARERALHLIEEFTAFMEQHRDQITALRIYYNQPYQRRNLTFQMVREVLDILKAEKPMLAPLAVWQAYEQVEGKRAGTPISELTALVALIRRVVGLDRELTLYEQTVNRNFQQWVFQKQAGAAPKFSEAQMEWLRMIKDHMISSLHIERDDLDYAPFDAQGGLARMYQLFGEEMDGIIEEMNEALAA